MGRKLAIVIAVAGSVPRKYLTGALNGARDFAFWATRMGYQTTLIMDDPAPVTMQGLKERMVTALTAGEGSIERLIVYFAGHGLIREAEENLWLLSDWQDELRAVAVDVLKRRLMRFGVEQVVLIGDACSSLPEDMTAADLIPDVPLPKGPKTPTGLEETDRFLAAQDGEPAFMIPGATPEEDRCVFTGVLMEGLWGAVPDAYSAVRPNAVTSQSLAAFLRRAAPARALTYGHVLKPAVLPTFSEGRDLYFTKESGSSRPALGAWPPPHKSLRATGTRKIRKMSPSPPSTLSWELAGRPDHDFGSPPQTRSLDPDPPVESPDPLMSWLSQTNLPSKGGLAVEGGEVETVWSDTEIDDLTEPDGGGVRLRFGRDKPASCLVKFANGHAGAFVTLPEMTTLALHTDRGIAAVRFAPVWGNPVISPQLAMALSKMEQSALRADDAIRLGVSLRQSKHADPVLGVISAYLYRAIDDIDSIRRMAFFYAQRGQAIPYDIALLGRLARMDGDQVHVPAVVEGAPRSDAEEQVGWAWRATPARSGRIAGRCPWMRQGWSHLEDVEDQPGSIVEPGLSGLEGHLTTARFTTLDSSGCERLAELMGMVRRDYGRVGMGWEG